MREQIGHRGAYADITKGSDISPHFSTTYFFITIWYLLIEIYVSFGVLWSVVDQCGVLGPSGHVCVLLPEC